MSNIEFAEEYFKTSNDAWLKLDIDFDVAQAQQEIKNVDQYYVDHRDGENHIGWTSCCLHGLGISKTLGWEHYATAETAVTYAWTDLAYLVPSITNFWKNIFPVEGYKRIRFMKLDPGGEIKLHRDHDPEMLKHYDIFRDGIAVNLAITHPVGCSMSFEGYGNVPWTPGSAIMLNVSKNHSVKNKSDLPRVHMIAHAIIGNRKREFADLLYRSYKKENA